MIEFKTLKISNFMAIGEAEVDLTQTGFTLVSGNNQRAEDGATSSGSGKSNIMESLVWALTGETIRGAKDIVNRFTEGDCQVKLTFDFKGYNWCISRGMTRDKEKSLEIYKNGEVMPAKGYRDAEEVLNRELPELNFKFLNSVVVMGQGLPGRFTNNSPSGRKAVLEELTNADYMITQIKDNITKRGQEISDHLRVNQDAVLKATSEKGILESLLKSQEEEFDKLKAFDIEADKRDLENLIVKGKEASAKVEELKIEEDKAVTLSKRIYEDYLNKGNSQKGEISNLRSKLEVSLVEIAKEKSEAYSKLNEELNSKVFLLNSKMDKLNEEISHNDSIVKGGYCKYCGQRLSGFSEEKIAEAKVKIEKAKEELKILSKEYTDITNLNSEEKSKLNLKFETKRTEAKVLLESQITAVENRYREELEKLKESSSEAMLYLNNTRESLSLAQSNLLDLRSQYQEKNTQIKSYEDRLTNLSNKIAETKNSIKVAEGDISIHSDLVEKYQERLKVNKQMNTFASRDFRGILLEGIINRLDQIIKGYAKIVYGNELTSFYLDGNSIAIEFDGKDYESLSGGEQQRLNLLIQLSLRDLIVETSGVSTSFLAIDECFDGLDRFGCDRVVELFQSLEISIWVITHRSELEIPFDQELIVVKGPDGVSNIQIGV